jgi:hypothetical protein
MLVRRLRQGQLPGQDAQRGHEDGHHKPSKSRGNLRRWATWPATLSPESAVDPPVRLGGRTDERPPGPKSVANWQTQFFSGHNLTCANGLRMKLSLPTVANSPGKLNGRLGAQDFANDIARHAAGPASREEVVSRERLSLTFKFRDAQLDQRAHTIGSWLRPISYLSAAAVHSGGESARQHMPAKVTMIRCHPGKRIRIVRQ